MYFCFKQDKTINKNIESNFKILCSFFFNSKNMTYRVIHRSVDKYFIPLLTLHYLFRLLLHVLYSIINFALPLQIVIIYSRVSFQYQ